MTDNRFPRDVTAPGPSQRMGVAESQTVEPERPAPECEEDE